ncbi:MAG: hypothetical protein K2I97_06085, partial [Alistipes sp.]|nr:hypothetical protein [Alistipes sp.]
WERMTARAATGKMQNSAQRLLLRWRIVGIVAAMLPFQLLPQFRGGEATIRYVGWILLGLFVVAAFSRICRLRGLLQEIDPVVGSLRETCAAVVRLRRSFLHGVVINVTLAVLLLGTLALHQWTLNRTDWLYAFGIGLCVGIPLGINLFYRTLQDIKVLAAALRNVDEPR